jgi:CSLREA domain-containing protein
MSIRIVLILMLLMVHPATAAILSVNTFADEFGSGSACSLREAVQSANTNADFGGCTHTGAFGDDTINLGQGFYTLSRGNFASLTDIDEDNNAVIDIDIRSSLTLTGTSSAVVSIGNTSGNYRGRILHVISGVVTINGVTLRDGNLPNGRAGAGLRSEPGTTVTLNNARVVGNEADGNAGGILNRATMTLNNTRVDANQTNAATQGGGGLFNDDNATLVLNDSLVLNNLTTGNGASGNGAGIYNDVGASLTLDNTLVDGNIIDVRGASGDGGGVLTAGSLILTQSTISNNIAAGTSAKGGGIRCIGTEGLIIERSLIQGNQTIENPDLFVDTPLGGGIAGCNLTVRDTLIAGNLSKGGGGGLEDCQGRIERTTISGNIADGGPGGGISNSSLQLVNTTVAANEAHGSLTRLGHGGGVDVGSGNTVSFFNATVVSNTSSASGGGISVSGGSARLSHTVIAGNLQTGIGGNDDCAGSITTLGRNLLQNSAGCTLSGSGSGTDLLNVNAQLDVLTLNGGAIVGTVATATQMPSRLPLSTSPLIDGGNPAGCVDNLGQILSVDQRGLPRIVDGPDPDTTAVCDIGAVEVQTVVRPDPIFSNSFE